MTEFGLCFLMLIHAHRALTIAACKPSNETQPATLKSFSDKCEVNRWSQAAIQIDTGNKVELTIPF